MPPGQIPRQLAYIDVGLGTVRFELIGPPTDQSLRQWLQDDYDRIIPPAPWWGVSTRRVLVARRRRVRPAASTPQSAC